MNRMAFVVILFVVCSQASGAEAEPSPQGKGVGILSGDFKWNTGEPVLMAPQAVEEDWVAIKDPSVVRYKDRWHVFTSAIRRKKPYATMYFSFDEWSRAGRAESRVLQCHTGGRFGAPQVFYFAPQKQWYLICQATDPSWQPFYGAAYSTTPDIADPASWSQLKPLGAKRAQVADVPEGKPGLDFWVICDEKKAHLFFTTLDGRMWREETRLEDFPGSWSEPRVALQGDIFEASHTYKLKGLDKYLTVVEAQGGYGWRYFKAYVADQLDGEWRPLAAGKEKAFASMQNVQQTGVQWTDSISHGELIRAGYDQRLEVDPEKLRFVFQGAADRDTTGKQYGEIPWRLGILELRP